MNINPVLYKELRLRMRGWKSAITLTAYLSILTLVTIFIVGEVFRNPYGTIVSRSTTMTSYITLTMFQFFLIAFIAPALTSGGISGERERQTLDLLLCTEMKPISIITGKLFASLSAVILLIVASLPILSIVFLFGGITVFNLVQVFVFYVILAITLGSIGLFFSTYLQRTTASNVVTYAVVLFLMFGTILITVFYYGFVRSGNFNNNQMPILMYINPFASFASLLMEQFGENFIGIVGLTSANSKGLPLWHINMVINLLISTGLIFLSARRLDPMNESERRVKRVKPSKKKVSKKAKK